MKFKVESCWAGGDNFYFRVTPPDTLNLDRFRVYYNGYWDKGAASNTLNEIYRLSGGKVQRKNVRFIHV